MLHKNKAQAKAQVMLLIPSVVILVLILASSLFSQQNQANTPCTCEEQFSVLTAKVETNYVGFYLRKNQIDSAYSARKQAFRERAQITPMVNCTQLLQHFLAFFGDGHLFVVDYPKYSSEELFRFKQERVAKKYLLNVQKFSNNALLEGYWTDGTSKYVIIKTQDSVSLQDRIGTLLYEYIAVIADAPNKAKIGEMKFAVKQSSTNVWEGVYWRNDYAPRYLSVSAYKDGTLLSLWGGITWGRLQGKESAETIPIFQPDEPTISRINTETMLLTIPSFLIEKQRLDKVFLSALNDLKSCAYLIIDIRGNTGGNSIYFDILTAYYERPAKSKHGWALASEDNITYFSKYTSWLGTDPYSPVVNAMKTSRQTSNRLVQGPIFPPLTLTAVLTNLKKIAILTDKGNKSAAETFVLHSKAISDKVLVMGENTGGVVDYNNVNIIPLSCEKYGIMLGYPTFTFHENIPNDGYNQTGIAPDVRIEATIQDKIGFVTEYLRKQK